MKITKRQLRRLINEAMIPLLPLAEGGDLPGGPFEFTKPDDLADVNGNGKADAWSGYNTTRRSGSVSLTPIPQTLNSYIQALQEMAKSVPGAGNLPIGSVVDEGGWIMEFEPVSSEPELITISDPDVAGDEGTGGEIPPGKYIVVGRHHR